MAREFWSFDQGINFLSRKPVPKYPSLIVIGGNSVAEEECLTKFRETFEISLYPYSKIRKDFGCWPDPFDLCRKIMEDFSGKCVFMFSVTNYFEELVAYKQGYAEDFINIFLHSQFIGGVAMFVENRFEKLIRKAVFDEQLGIGCGGVATWQ